MTPGRHARSFPDGERVLQFIDEAACGRLLFPRWLALVVSLFMGFVLAGISGAYSFFFVRFLVFLARRKWGLVARNLGISMAFIALAMLWLAAMAFVVPAFLDSEIERRAYVLGKSIAWSMNIGVVLMTLGSVAGLADAVRFQRREGR